MTLEEEFSLLLDCGVTLEEDFTLLLDFAELLEAMLLLDFIELLLDRSSTGVEDDERTLLLDRSSTGVEDDERTELLDRSSTGAEDDERTLLLDFGATLEEDDFALTLEEDFALDEEFDFTELLLASSQSSQTLDEESSPGRTKLLSSSQAAKNARANPSKKRFIQKILLRYVVYLANFPSSLHPVFIIFPAKKGLNMTIDEFLGEAKTVAIFGHVRPDGDCVGSTTAIYNYIRDNFPGIHADLFLEKFPENYKILRGASDAREAYTADCNGRQPYDLAFLMDTPSFERVGANGAECIRVAKKTINIDHHISNPLNLCTMNLVEPEASSACEVVYVNIDKAKVSRETANSLYLGIVHDTGAFKFSSTGKRTMQVVGDLIEKGIDFAKIVNETYYTRTYKQTLVTGFVMQNCKLGLGGKVVYAHITPEDMERFDVSPVELSNVIDTVREVGGTEVALFLYPVNGKYKISLRSNYIVDVNAIAREFGGGGHTRAAGGDTSDAPEVAIEKILKLIEKQL